MTLSKITQHVLHWQGQECLFSSAHMFIYCVLVSICFFPSMTKRPKEKGRAGHCRGDGSECVSQLSSSGLCCSNSRTWVKGKWPRLPLHSPSHWPFTLILVTFTMSPTCQMTKNIYIYINAGTKYTQKHFLCSVLTDRISLCKSNLSVQAQCLTQILSSWQK